jgi:hypothetical protein
VWHTPQPPTLIRISVPFGLGIGSCSNRSGSPGA